MHINTIIGFIETILSDPKVDGIIQEILQDALKRLEQTKTQAEAAS